MSSVKRYLPLDIVPIGAYVDVEATKEDKMTDAQKILLAAQDATKKNGLVSDLKAQRSLLEALILSYGRSNCPEVQVLKCLLDLSDLPPMDYEDQGIEWDAIETIASMALIECENAERAEAGFEREM